MHSHITHIKPFITYIILFYHNYTDTFWLKIPSNHANISPIIENLTKMTWITNIQASRQTCTHTHKTLDRSLRFFSLTPWPRCPPPSPCLCLSPSQPGEVTPCGQCDTVLSPPTLRITPLPPAGPILSRHPGAQLVSPPLLAWKPVVGYTTFLWLAHSVECTCSCVPPYPFSFLRNSWGFRGSYFLLYENI